MENKPSNFEYSAMNTVKGFAMPVFAFREILRHFRLKTKKYEMTIKPVYDNLNGILNDELLKKPQETHEIERFHMNGGKTMNFDVGNGQNYADDDCIYQLEQKDNLEREIDNIEKLLSDCNVRRRKLLSQLKEKIVETVFSRILF
jgi:hypothetical protein